MRQAVEIENIEEMRRREGIDDVELHDAIRKLRVGDFVKLTLLDGVKASETLVVRITNIKGGVFRGKLASNPTCAGLMKLTVGSPLAFSTVHIHSVRKEQAGHE